MIEMHTLYVIAHVFGAVIGAGGAFASDAMFFSSVKDGRINSEELRFMRLGSKLVWTGLAILVVSGIFIVSTDSAFYLASNKFLAKMTIVSVIIINGVIFHLMHIPHIKKHLELKLSESRTFMKRAPVILVSGAISMVSWIFTVTLGVMKAVPFTYSQIIGAYLLVVCVASLSAFVLKRVILR